MGKYSAKSRIGAKLKKAIRSDGPAPAEPEAIVPNHRRRTFLSIAAVLAIVSIVMVTAAGKASLLWGPSQSGYYQSGYYNETYYPGDTQRVGETWSLSQHRQFAQALAQSEAIATDPKASKEEICTSEVDVSYNAWQLGRFPEASKAVAAFDKEGRGLQIDPDIIAEANHVRKRLARGPSTKYYNAISGANWAGKNKAPQNLSFASPHGGWFLARGAGDRKLYSIGVDANGYPPNQPCGYLMSNDASTDDWNTLRQDVAADSYRGKRIRFSGYLKGDNVSDGAYIWLRVDSPTGNSFETVPDPTIIESSPWQQQAIVLDVPQDAQGIAFGAVLQGSGKVSLANVHLDVVGSDVPITQSY